MAEETIESNKVRIAMDFMTEDTKLERQLKTVIKVSGMNAGRAKEAITRLGLQAFVQTAGFRESVALVKQQLQ